MSPKTNMKNRMVLPNSFTETYLLDSIYELLPFKTKWRNYLVQCVPQTSWKILKKENRDQFSGGVEPLQPKNHW
jgi:hypothetical protein